MAKVRDTRRARNAGRAMLSLKERRLGTPWYAGKNYERQQEGRLKAAARRASVAHEKALIRLEKATA